MEPDLEDAVSQFEDVLRRGNTAEEMCLAARAVFFQCAIATTSFNGIWNREISQRVFSLFEKALSNIPEDSRYRKNVARRVHDLRTRYPVKG